MGNVRKMGENRIIEQQRSDKNYRTTKKVRSKFRYVFFFIPSEENRIIEQQGTVNNINNHTFVLLNFRAIIPAPTVLSINKNNNNNHDASNNTTSNNMIIIKLLRMYVSYNK